MTPKRIIIASAAGSVRFRVPRKMSTLAPMRVHVTMGVRRVWLMSRIGITVQREP